MFSKGWVLDMVSQLAYSSTHLALKSIEAHQTYRNPQFPSRNGRLRLKHVVEKLLCFREDDSSSYLPAPIRVPAQATEEIDAPAGMATRCFQWLKDKAQPGHSKEAADHQVKDPEQDEDKDEDGDEAEDQDQDEDEDPYTEFKQVFEAMNTDGLPQYASSLRQSEAIKGFDQPTDFECEIDLNTPMLGSFHMVFPVIFSDGVQWLFRVPAAGRAGRWDSSAARSLRSEAMTMRLLRQKTSIPVPKVYAFESSLDNDFKCPFILMERMGGEALYEKWYDGSTSVEAQEKFRENALRSLANATVQLSTFQYAQGGALAFDDNGDVLAIESVRVYDCPAMHNRMASDSTESDNLFCEIGPFDTSKAYFHSMLNKHRRPSHVLVEGCYEIFRTLIDWISVETSTENETFMLAHPDLNLQNILVAEDGTVQGLIDWDGVAAVPRSVGCAFPKWLTLDWDPYHYNFGREIDCECEDQHHSPDEMKYYRALYAQFIREATSGGQSEFNETALQLADTTRKSVVIGSIDQAARNPFSFSAILSNIVDKIAHITSQSSFMAHCNVTANTSEDAQSLQSVRQCLDFEDAAIVQGVSSMSGSNHSNDSDSSEMSLLAESSTEASDPPSEPNHDQIGPQLQNPPGSSSVIIDEKPSADLVTAKSSDDKCKFAAQQNTHRHWVVSLIQKASHCWRANAERLRLAKAHSQGFTKPSLSVSSSQSDATSNPSCCLSPAARNQPVLEQWLPESKHASNKEIYCGDSTCTCTDANPALEADMSEKQMGKRAQANRSLNSRRQGATWGKDKEEDNTSPSSSQSSSQATESDNSMQINDERDGRTSPSNLLPTGQPRQKRSFGRRLKAKFALHHGQPPHRLGSNLSNGSSESINQNKVFGRLASRRKRIIEWVKTVGHTSLDSGSGDESASNSMLEKTLPKIPKLSGLDLPHLNDPHSGTDIVLTNDSVPGPTGYKDLKLATYDAGEPVDDAKLGDEGFLTAQICYDVMDGTLDEARMQRLKQGFAALLDSL